MAKSVNQSFLIATFAAIRPLVWTGCIELGQPARIGTSVPICLQRCGGASSRYGHPLARTRPKRITAFHRGLIIQLSPP
jgi:hypothetical protein